MLLWTDLETTGLDPKNDLIIEIAWKFTYDDLTPTKSMVGNHVLKLDPMFAEAMMIPFVKQMHTDNGLLGHLNKALHGKAETVLRATVAHELLLQFQQVKELTDEPVMLAGASVHFDLGFIKEYMPTVAEELSHRIYDVSTLKTFFRNSGSTKDLMYGLPEFSGTQHRAKDDMEHSYLEAAYLQTIIQESN